MMIDVKVEGICAFHHPTVPVMVFDSPFAVELAETSLRFR
jgi:hypothetical protein